MGLFDAVGSALSSAGEAVGDAISGAGEVVADVASGAGDVIGDTFETIGSSMGPLGDVVDGALDILSSGSLGGMLNTALDKLGLPDWVGDIGGGVLDFCTGNMVGVAANGLDALEDVAKACGGDEIAGFLKAGSDLTGMFSGGLKAGPAQMNDLVGTATESYSRLDDALEGVDALIDGDIAGAGDSLLNLVGEELGPLKELSETGSNLLGEAVPQAKEMLGAVGGALADGRLEPDDLDQLPLGDLVGDAVDDLGGLAGPVVEFCGDAYGAANQFGVDGLAAADDLGGSLFAAITEQIADVLGADHSDIEKLESNAEFAQQLVNMATTDPDALGVIKDLLGETTLLNDAVDTLGHHGASLRA